jgi:cytidyltransferase-like protein
MKNTNIKVVTFGVFDVFHYGHLRLFKNIKKAFGEDCFLTVCVQDGDTILKYKPNAKVVYSTEERIEIIKSLKCVDDVKIYSDIDVDIKDVYFDVWVKGPDQIHEGFQRAIQWCKENNKVVQEIHRTEGISSSFLKTVK